MNVSRPVETVRVGCDQADQRAAVDQGRSNVLTHARCSDEPGAHVRGLTCREERLHQVVCKRNGDDRLTGRLNDQQRCPQANKRKEAAKRLQDVRIGRSWFGDGGAQLGVAEGPHDRKQASDHPDDQGQPVGGAVDQHALWGDEDSRADHVSHD